MKKQMIPALVGFWVGHVVTSVLLFGWMMLGILWYFMGTSDLWYDVTAIMIALLIPLMAGGLTRKKRPYILVKSLWMAAGADMILLALILAVYHGIVACGNYGLGATVFQGLLLDGTILATGVPLVLEKISGITYAAREINQEIVGLFLPPLAFTVGYLLAKRPE